jgi:hypothetical protein
MSDKRELIDVRQDGDLFVMTISTPKEKSKERWTYEREELNGCVSYIMIGREELTR